MSDNLSREDRHRNMQNIKSTDTKPEEIVCRFLFSQGFRYRKHDKRFPGKPDIVLPKYKTVIFVHGCFWHMHEGCSCFVMPKSNINYWKPKLERNHERDIINAETLRNSGWDVITIWECELKKARRIDTLNHLAECLRKKINP